MFAHQFHGGNDLPVGSFTAALISRLFIPFNRKSQSKIADPQQFLTKLFIHQGSVGKGKEETILVGDAQFNQVLLPHKRFASGEDVEIDTKLLPLAADEIKHIVG